MLVQILQCELCKKKFEVVEENPEVLIDHLNTEHSDREVFRFLGRDGDKSGKQKGNGKNKKGKDGDKKGKGAGTGKKLCCTSGKNCLCQKSSNGCFFAVLFYFSLLLVFYA